MHSAQSMVVRGTLEVMMGREDGAPYGTLLQETRLRAGKSVAEVARAAQMSEGHVRDVERGTRGPMGVGDTRRVANALGCDAGPLVEAMLRRRDRVELGDLGSGVRFEMARWLALNWDLLTDEELLRALDALRKVRAG